MFRHNWYQLRNDLDAQGDFEAEASFAAHDAVRNFINQHGYSSIAELRVALKKEPIEDLTSTIECLKAQAEDHSRTSKQPDASPEDSFSSLVGVYKTEACLRILKSIVRELERSNDVSTDNEP